MNNYFPDNGTCANTDVTKLLDLLERFHKTKKNPENVLKNCEVSE